MIDEAGTVKIIDFGSVKVASVIEGKEGNFSQMPACAVDYIAPEYLLYGDGDNKSDLYSLGAIIYEILTHRLPYGKGFSTLRRAKQLDYIPATVVNSDVPPWIDFVLKKAVKKDPRERYQALSQFERDFTAPPATTEKKNFSPLLEKNPLLFWRVLSLFLAMLLVMSLLLDKI